MTEYDALYRETPNVLGPQDKGVKACLDRLPPPPCHILDFGAGQGRDAKPLARAGYQITAVDIAASGLEQLTQDASTEGLLIHCVCGSAADLDGPFDVLLINRTLHMILDDAERAAVLWELLRHLAPGGYVLIEDERSNIPGLKSVMNRHGAWDWIEETPRRLFARTAPG